MTAATVPDHPPPTQKAPRSLYRRIIGALGSLKLALLLLATIAAACAVATICESRFDTKVAQAYIYKAPWFTVWLGVLCVNLFAVTLTRWPWQRRHLGFVITHYGIIALLIGAMIGSHFGFEGNVTLHKGKPPVDRITTARTLLQIGRMGAVATLDFDPALARPTPERPSIFDVPGSAAKLIVDGFSTHLQWRSFLTPAADTAPAGATLRFASTTMGQRLEIPLELGTERDFFGLARIAFAATLPKRVPPEASETQMVFAKFAPVVRSEGGATGLRASLSADGATVTFHDAAGRMLGSHPRAEIEGRRLMIGKVSVEVGGYWPDFELVAGQPATASKQPRNPAVLIRFRGPAQPVPGERPRPLLELAPAADGLAYQLSRADDVYRSGVAKVGESFALGWADWMATVEQVLPHAAISESLAPGEEAGLTGLHVRLRAPDGKESEPLWIPAGSPAELALRGEQVRVNFGLEQLQVPFSIALENFEVPRVEGTDTPANFIASVEFRDAKTGATRRDVAQMNHPASWPGGAFAVTTGLNYKFSQAQWNPQDLGETTLQVLYDPGWLLKWTGSLAICIGIFIMFYLRPKKKTA